MVTEPVSTPPPGVRDPDSDRDATASLMRTAARIKWPGGGCGGLEGNVGFELRREILLAEGSGA